MTPYTFGAAHTKNRLAGVWRDISRVSYFFVILKFEAISRACGQAAFTAFDGSVCLFFRPEQRIVPALREHKVKSNGNSCNMRIF